MNLKLFIQIILGVFGIISVAYTITEPNKKGIIAGIIGIVLIAIFLAITL